MKRFATILLVMFMILSMAATASAAGTNSITVNNTKAGETYEIYKLLDLSVDLEKKAYTYTVNATWSAFFGAATGVTIDENGYVTGITDAAALAKDAAKYAKDNGIDALNSIKADGESVVFDGLEDGYYLITSTLGTFAMTETTPDKEAVSVNDKNPEDTINKTVKEDSTGIYGEKNDAQIGDLVEFKSEITLVKGTRNVVVHDKMDAGLTYTAGSVKIEGLTKDTDYTVNEAPADGDTFDIVFVETYLNTLADGETKLTLTYTATLNAQAVQTNEIVVQNNKISIAYGDSQSVDDGTTTTTHKFTVHKYADGVTNLADAVFSLKKNGVVVPLIKIDATNYRVAMAGETGAVDTFTTVADGNIVIWGVDADNDYTLKEITAPAGYNLLADEVKVSVSADNALVVDVENNAGTELPSTGGVGTTVFYVIGGLMMLMAVVLLVTKKRMASAE